MTLRKNKYEVVNNHGKSLLEFLKDSKLCTINGKIGNSDDFTCVKSNGKSVIDNIITDHLTVADPGFPIGEGGVDL